MNRREFLFGLSFAWLPFFHYPYVTLSDIRFHVRRYRRAPRRYLLIHGNESTARQLLEIHMDTHPGIAYLVTGTDRYVTIGSPGVKLDPNRMFSRAGAERNLKSLNPAASPDQMEQALNFLDRNRENMLRRFVPPRDGLLVALHNNQEYSVTDEVSASDSVSLKQPSLPQDFFLCTDPRDYEILAGSPYNVVLQNKKPAEDDGSLSRLAAHRGFRYVNLECALGAFEAQLERLSWLENHLR